MNLCRKIWCSVSHLSNIVVETETEEINKMRHIKYIRYHFKSTSVHVFNFTSTNISSYKIVHSILVGLKKWLDSITFVSTSYI